MGTNKNLKELKYYKNLYIKYKNKYIQKKTIQQGGLNAILQTDDNKSYQTKLNEFKDKISHILDKKHHIHFIEYCKNELNELDKEDDLTNQEKNDFNEICNNIDKLNNTQDKVKIDKIYGGLLTFIHKYNYSNLKEYAEKNIAEKKAQRYNELIHEFDRNNYHRGGFIQYHKLDSLPKNINLFQSTIQNHYKQPKSFKYNIQKKFKKYFKDNKFFNYFF